MRILTAILRSLIALALGLIVFVVAGVALIVGTIAVLVLGRRARFQIYRGGTMGMGADAPASDPWGPRPPIRDVTPIKPRELN
jgi:hypothetical protein